MSNLNGFPWLAWLLTRLVEFSALSLVLLWLFGWPTPSIGRGFIDAFLRTATATLFFYLTSGYFVGVALLPILLRRQSLMIQSVSLALAFLLGVFVFTSLSSMPDWTGIWAGAAIGSIVVFAVNFLMKGFFFRRD